MCAMTENYSFEDLKINPDRICEAISKIGYKPSSAIMDIVDNSITAGATEVYIDFFIEDSSTLNERNNILKLRIIDNGSGMDTSRIKTALDIGSSVSYPQNSLSKFGLGLKSAGFSLGNRIEVVSKQGSFLSDTYYLDREIIRARQTYGVCRMEVSQESGEILRDFPNGTIIKITDLIKPLDAAGKIKNDLQEKLGVTYYHFLSRQNNPITITLRIYKQNSIVNECSVSPIDILFEDQANDSFDPDNYDGKLPCKVLDNEIENPYNPEGDKIKIKVVIFPKSEMANFAGFSEEERDRIKTFMINRANSGFFFFRNERLIRWGDNIAGAGRDDIGFRAKVMLTTAHDDLFHVDVSKQHLSIPDEMLNTLNLTVRIPLAQSKQLFEKCNLIKSQSQGEGEEFNRRTKTFQEEDADEHIAPPPREEKARRRKHIIEKSQEKETQEIGSNEFNSTIASSEPTTFQRVRYSESTYSLSPWEAGQDPLYGTYVRINKSHPFYKVILSSLEVESPARLAMEGLLFCLAIAQNRTIENLSCVSVEDIEKVLEKFKRVFTHNLDSWISENQNLFE